MNYKITHPECLGHITVQYNEQGELVMLFVDGAQMLPHAKGWFDWMLQEAMVNELPDHGGFIVKLVRGQSAHEKVTLWCRLYKELKGVAYKMTPPEVGMLKKLEVEEPFLRYYLNDATLPENSTTWLWRGKQDVRNLNTHYNKVRTQYEQPREVAKPKSAFPDHWQPEYAKRLDGLALTAYRQHLRGLGLVPKVDRTGQTVDYVKPDALD